MLTNKILLIDDDPEEFDLLCEAVSIVDKNLGCVQAMSCKEGFGKLDSSKGLPKCIFLDLNMPPSHGKHCLERIKKHPVYSSIPVFIYTTSTLQEDLQETKRLGAVNFFNKPDSMQELKKIVSYVISGQWKDN